MNNLLINKYAGLVSRIGAVVLLAGTIRLTHGAEKVMLLEEDFSKSIPRRIEEGGNTPLSFFVVDEDAFRKENDATPTGTDNRVLLLKGTDVTVLFEGLSDFELTLRVNYVRRSPANTVANFEPGEIKIDLGGAFRYKLNGTLEVQKTNDGRMVQDKATDVFDIPTAGTDRQSVAIQTLPCDEAAVTRKWEWKWLKFDVEDNRLRVFTSPTGDFRNDAVACAEATTDQPLNGTITFDIEHYPIETILLVDDIKLTGAVPMLDLESRDVNWLAGNLLRGLYYTKGDEAAIRMISAAKLGHLGSDAVEALPYLMWREYVSVGRGNESASLGEQLVLQNAIRQIDPDAETLPTLIKALSSNQPEFRRVLVDALLTGTWQQKWWERLDKSTDREEMRARDPKALVQYSSTLVELLGHHNPDVRWSTLNLLDKTGEECPGKVTAELLKSLENGLSGSLETAEVVERAAAGLQALVEHDALLYGSSLEAAWGLLHHATQSGNACIRAAAITAMAELYASVKERQQQLIIEHVSRGLRDVDASARVTAARAVETVWKGGAETAEMVGDLKNMLSNSNAEARWTAVSILGKISASNQIYDASNVGKETLWATRQRVEEAALELPVLTKLLTDEAPGVRAAAADALGEVMSRATTAPRIETVGIAKVSAEHPGRKAVNTVNGSGIEIDTKGAYHIPNTGQWMAGNEDAPWSITFDLENEYSLTALRVWNFNLANALAASRAANEVRISVADASGGTWTILDSAPGAEGVQNFFLASPGETSNYGESIDLPTTRADSVRLVKFDILSNHSNGTDPHTGLGEVRFFGAAIPKFEPNVEALRQQYRKVEEERAMAQTGLLQRLEQDADPTVRREAAIALARIGMTDRDSGLTLIEAVAGEDDAAARSAALRALGGMNLPEALPVFKRHLADESGPVRDAAAAGLTKLGINPQEMETYEHRIELGLRKAREQLSPDPVDFGGYTLTPAAVVYAQPFEYQGGLEKANALLAAYCRHQTEFGRGARQADTQLFGAYLHRETKALLTDEVCAAIEDYAWTQAPRRKALSQADLGFDDVGGSENWTLIDHTRTYLALLVLARSERYGPAVEVEGKPVAYHIAKWTDFWMRFVKDRATRSLDLEINTKASYASITFNSYHDLFTYTPSSELRELIGNFLTLYFAEEAVTGGAIASTRRSNIETPDGFWAEMFLKAYGWRGWSAEWNYPYYLGMAGSSVFADYRIPGIVPAIARDKDRGCYLVNSRRDGIGLKPDNSWVLRDVYYTPDYTHGTLTYDPTKPYVNVIRIAQLMGVDFPTANDYIVAGPHGGHYGSMALSGITGTNVSVIARPVNAAFGEKQFSSTGIQVFFSRKGTLYPTHVADDSGWHFFQSGDAYAAVRVAGEKTIMQEDKESGRLVPEDIWAPIVIQTGRKPDYENYEAFQAKVRDNKFGLENDLLTYESEAGDVYEYPRKSVNMPRINGKTVATDPEPGDKIIDSPFLIMIHGEDKATITYPGHEPLVLDFGKKDSR